MDRLLQHNKSISREEALKQHAEVPFFSFIFKTPLHKWILIISAILLAAQFIIFHSLYPFPNLMMDSYGYMEAALNNSDIAMRPIGYSKFLHYCSFFTRSDLGLVLFQFVFLELSIFIFTFALIYLLTPGKVITSVMFVLTVLNPVWFFLCNFVAADAIFTGLSLLWISVLLGILYYPKSSLIWLHAILLLLLFTIRYNAIFYPIVSALAFGLSVYTTRVKIFGFVISVLLVGLFVWDTSSKFKMLTGRRQLSVFAGWQIASNAIFMYSSIGRPELKVPPEFALLHEEVNMHLLWMKDTVNYEVDMAYFMWRGPLSKFAHIDNKKETEGAYFERFSNVSDLYSRYGEYLIKQYPKEYFRFFILNNASRHFFIPIEILGYYYTSQEQIKPLAKEWFKYNSDKVKAYSEEITALNPYPYINVGVNTLFVICIIGCFVFVVFKSDQKLKKTIILILILWLSNAAFSIIASPVVLRYQLFNVLVILLFSIVLIPIITNAIKLVAEEEGGKKNEPDIPVIEPTVHSDK